MLKLAFKRFKHRTSLGFQILKEIDLQHAGIEIQRRSVVKTVEHLFQAFKSSHKKRFTDQLEVNNAILKAYGEGINELKKYEVHASLKRDGKQTLMDFYYDEAQMNKWRDSCLRSQESLKKKVETFERESASLRSKFTIAPTLTLEEKHRDLQKRLESLVNEKEPLIISILSTVYEDLRELHRYLGIFCGAEPSASEVQQAQAFFQNVEGLRARVRQHQDLERAMEEHSKEIESLIESAKRVQLSNA